MKLNLSDYQKGILNELLNKFENKSNYGKEALPNRRIGIEIKRYFKEYMHLSDSRYKSEINLEMQVLEKHQFVELRWEKYSMNQYLDKVYLNAANLKHIYESLNRISKEEKCLKFASILEDFLEISVEELKSFIQININKLKNFETPNRIINLDDEITTKDYLNGLNELVKPKSKEISKRQLSIQLYNNSKRWEVLEGKILSVIKNDIYQEFGNMEDSVILANFSVLDNPVPIDMYGNCIMTKSKKEVDFTTDENGLALYPSFYNEAEILSLDIRRVITIENKTSYHDYLRYVQSEDKELVIYLGGFHNNIRTILLKKIYDYSLKNKLKIQFYHWGDMDLGGFSILVNLINKTGIPFQPMYMDEITYLEYLKYGKEITDNSYLNKLRGLLKLQQYSRYENTINLIIQYKLVIEQESIDLEKCVCLK